MTKTRSFRPLRASALALAAILVSTASAGLAAAEPCTITETSRGVQGKIQGWYEDAERASRLREDVSDILKEIEEERAKSRYNCRDRSTFYVASLFVAARSPDPVVASDALAPIVAATAYDGSGTKEDNVRELIKNYIDAERYAELRRLVETEIPKAPQDLLLKLYLEKAYLDARDGELGEALDLLLANLKTYGEDEWMSPFHLAIAIAQEMGDTDTAAVIEEASGRYFEKLYMPRPHPLAGNNQLQTLLMRHFELRDDRPLKPPVPSYPDYAAWGDREGKCEVFFYVDVEGKPMNIKAECTDIWFEDESVKAIRDLRYEPLVVDGVAYERYDIIYPLEYRQGD